jgi:hypothetical protein
MDKKEESVFSKIWRIFGGIVGLLMVLTAVMKFIDFLVNKDPISIAPLAWLGGGIVFLTIAWRGHLLRD